MSTISGISSASSAWSNMSAMRNNRPPGGMSPDKMFAKVDSDSSGGVDKTELQGLLDDVTQKTGTTFSSSTDELFSKLDSNSDGNLSQDELGEGMQSIMPPPPSTMDFAQTRSDSSTSTGTSGGSDDLFGKIDSDGSGGVSKDELQALVDKMSSDSGSSSTSSTSSDSDMFSQLDTDGDGSLTQAEFEAGRPQGGQGMQAAGGMPPPPPPPGGAEGSAKSSTSYDPLDTNQDGVVSAAEQAAGSSATDAFIKSLTSQYEASSSSAQSTASGSSSQQNRLDLSKLVMLAYQQIAGGLNQQTQGTSLSALA